MSELLHLGARKLWALSLGANDRVLVVGASGWFGRTAVALLNELPNQTLFIASSERDISAPFGTYHCLAWNWDIVEQFAPTVVIDCAFLTRDQVGSIPFDEYVRRNEALTKNLLALAELNSVRVVISISSGAAVFPTDALTMPVEVNPYGYLKRKMEKSLETLADARGISAVIARAWSVSGAFVQKPQSYALSDMILQARSGAVTISARGKVYRRYVSVEDLLAVSLGLSGAPGARTLDSGGELVEMRELAERVVSVVNPLASITRAKPEEESDNKYYAAEESWLSSCSETELTPANLEEQIALVSRGLREG